MKIDKKLNHTVLFSITNGWAIRNFVHTGLIKKLSKSMNITIATTPLFLDYFFDLKEVGIIDHVIEIKIKDNYFKRRLRHFKKLILQTNFNISTFKIKIYGSAKNNYQKWFFRFTLFFLKKFLSMWQFHLIEKLENKLFISNVLKLTKTPNVFINCSPFYFLDNELQGCLDEKVLKMSFIPSWDNLSSKGAIRTDSDFIFVWSEHMKKEITSFYKNINPKKVIVSGPLQFDIYNSNLSKKYSQSIFRKRYKIPQKAKIILYATASQKLVPNEPDIIYDIADACMKNFFGEDVFLLIRCHPDDDFKRYKNLSKDFRYALVPSSVPYYLVEFTSQKKDRDKDASSKIIWNEGWIPPQDELQKLAAMMKYCDICINAASTMTLDAIACNKPVINTAYDGKNKLPYYKSTRRFYDFHHYKTIKSSNAIPVANSSKQLMNLIKIVLNNSNELQARQNAVFKKLCTIHEEGAVEFFINKLNNILEKNIKFN